MGGFRGRLAAMELILNYVNLVLWCKWSQSAILPGHSGFSLLAFFDNSTEVRVSQEVMEMEM